MDAGAQHERVEGSKLRECSADDFCGGGGTCDVDRECGARSVSSSDLVGDEGELLLVSVHQACAGAGFGHRHGYRSSESGGRACDER